MFLNSLMAFVNSITWTFPPSSEMHYVWQEISFPITILRKYTESQFGSPPRRAIRQPWWSGGNTSTAWDVLCIKRKINLNVHLKQKLLLFINPVFVFQHQLWEQFDSMHTGTWITISRCKSVWLSEQKCAGFNASVHSLDVGRGTLEQEEQPFTCVLIDMHQKFSKLLWINVSSKL